MLIDWGIWCYVSSIEYVIFSNKHQVVLGKLKKAFRGSSQKEGYLTQYSFPD